MHKWDFRCSAVQKLEALGVSSQPSVENKCDDVNIATRIMKSLLNTPGKIFLSPILCSKCYTVLADNIGVSHQRLLSRIPRRYRRQIPTKFFRPGPVKILHGFINVPVLLLDHSQIQVWQVPEKKQADRCCCYSRQDLAAARTFIYTGASTFATPPLIFPLFLVAGNSCF